MSSPVTAHDPRTPPEPLGREVVSVAIVVVLGAVMSVLDTTIVNVALETLARDLGSPLADIQWIVTGYLLALAAVIPITGWASRRWGARRLYLTALVLFTAGSALCALAWSTPSLVAARVIQGAGGGLLLPVGQMILARAAGPQRMGRVMGLVGVAVVMAPIFGPVLGGVLLESAGWEWIFLINVPVGAVAVVAALRLLPHDEPQEAGRLDLAGMALLAPGLVGITYGLAETATHDLASAPVVLPLLAGAVLVVAFALRALRIPRPLLDVRLFQNGGFRNASLLTFALGAAMFGSMILLPLYFQTLRGESATATGLLMAPQGVGAALAMFLSGRLTERYGGGLIATIGVVVTAVATIPFAFIGAETSYVLIGAAMVVRGIGIGIAFVPAMSVAFAVLRPDQVGDASPQLNTLQRVGGSLGTALFTVVLQHRLDDAAPGAAGAADGFASTYWWVLGVTLLALLPALRLLAVERAARRATDVQAVEEAQETLREAVPA
ncbi:DHA2 family efflux MFS transporter permease subunit [Conexibacter sp. W3-3-2]|uniref:DHA2 family efflux MFS transporter permease subunit n=1 Tax=Conexibacter sp. W3-3-2 TaxID=2675227 RepID=UPI0012BA0F23|nr:DHA2 family efflux MFS transporter permease subunit [Conexibacter sp. W3-3-2]MTD45240.1 DHA2 family efflux MFS transporter permease subunit [Conexibacter sp. W3-3-2]